MCGIFGVLVEKGASAEPRQVVGMLETLFLLSESRGKESAGLHAYLPEQRLAWTMKADLPASELIRQADFKGLVAEMFQARSPGAPLAVLAHSRLVTNGAAERPENNQPVPYGAMTLIHNGIVVNVDALWQANPALVRQAEVDTEVLGALLDRAIAEGASPSKATRGVYRQIRGAASIAWVHDRLGCVTLATNTGDLYYARQKMAGLTLFASERYILETALAKLGETQPLVTWLKPGSGVCISLQPDGVQTFDMTEQSPEPAEDRPLAVEAVPAKHHVRTISSPKRVQVALRPVDTSLIRYRPESLRALKRCTRCILPETFPFIHFDQAGVCNYCLGYQTKYAGIDVNGSKQRFLDKVASYRRSNGEPDVLIPFSGGRDSCYGLHLIKKEFGFTPVTFTYDWGMVTDLARRNVARLCGSLGVQNILVSADIKTKRENIRKNVSAWLKRPNLGMVPLFMAGDKHFFKIVNDLKRQTGIRLDVWAANPLENTDFKSGFCGVAPDFGKARLDYLSWGRKLHLAAYYGRQFLTNPGYLNSSLIDTAMAFSSYYIEPRNDFFFMFYDLIWDEQIVNQVLLDTYDFELSPDSPSTWRIGDGTAPFYNYIYLTARGFSEFDTFRSNQIREGMIDRAIALEQVMTENVPRVESLIWYFETIGLDFNAAIREVNKLDTMGLHA